MSEFPTKSILSLKYFEKLFSITLQIFESQTCLAFAVNFGSEKSPKSESDSFSVATFFEEEFGFETGFAVADFFGTALLLRFELFAFELFFEILFEEDFFLFSSSLEFRDDPLRSFVAAPFFPLLLSKTI